MKKYLFKRTVLLYSKLPKDFLISVIQIMSLAYLHKTDADDLMFEIKVSRYFDSDEYDASMKLRKKLNRLLDK